MSAGLSRFYANPKIDATTISITSIVNYREIFRTFGHSHTYFVSDTYLFAIRIYHDLKVDDFKRLTLLMYMKICRIIQIEISRNNTNRYSNTHRRLI